MSEHRVTPSFYTVQPGEILSGMHSRSQYLWLLPGGKSCGQFYLATALPACLLFTLITMLVFSLQHGAALFVCP